MSLPSVLPSRSIAAAYSLIFLPFPVIIRNLWGGAAAAAALGKNVRAMALLTYVGSSCAGFEIKVYVTPIAIAHRYGPLLFAAVGINPIIATS